jgi:hypothetical protein
VAGRRQPDVVGGGAEPGGDGADGQAGADERVQVAGADAVGIRAGPGDAGGPGERRFPGDGLVDAGVGEQGAGLLVQAAGHRLGQGEQELGVVLAAALGQPKRPGLVAGMGAGEQLDQAEPGELLLHRGGVGQAGVVEIAALRPVGGVGEEVALAAPAGPARIPEPARGGELAATLPPLLWPGWTLRLMPLEGFDLLRYRAALAIMLAVAVTGAEDYRAAQDLLGRSPSSPAGWPPSPPGSARTAPWNR